MVALRVAPLKSQSQGLRMLRNGAKQGSPFHACGAEWFEGSPLYLLKATKLGAMVSAGALDQRACDCRKSHLSGSWGMSVRQGTGGRVHV